jgi:hypothetical protein
MTYHPLIALTVSAINNFKVNASALGEGPNVYAVELVLSPSTVLEWSRFGLAPLVNMDKHLSIKAPKS